MALMQQVLDTPLVAAPSHLDAPAIISGAVPWTWRDIHEASVSFSRRLGDATAVCNVCTSRVSFLVTWLAALRRGCLVILPPSRGQSELAAILSAHARPVIAFDDPQALPTQDQQTPFLPCVLQRPVTRSPDSDLAWQPDWDALGVLLYTSGSSGTPEPQRKSLRHLAAGALVLGARLEEDVPGGLRSIRRIVCSVPPQHMFGVECAVMLPLLHAIPVLDGRPLLPADVRQALADSSKGAWIATPLHLRSLVQAGDGIENCSVVISSTMPLAPSLALQVENLVAAPVLEIYGSTETGVLAMRRTATEAAWRPVRGVELESGGNATVARGEHFESPQQLLDEIDIIDGSRFELLGRQADLIKIAGRRASLAALNLLLLELPGLEDGAFYLPASGHPTERMCLMHTGALDRLDADRWLRARIDPMFIPREFIRVDHLPRDGNGKLPRRALDAVYQRIKGARPTSTRGFCFSIPPDHPALPGHFPGRPLVPGVLLLDHVLAHVRTSMNRSVSRLLYIKFSSALLPGETALTTFEVTEHRIKFIVTTLREGTSVTLASGSLAAAPTLAKHA